MSDPKAARAYYERYAKALIKDLREQREVAYKELAERLEATGVRFQDPQALINKINRGRYSFVFALQVLSVLGARSIPIPEPPPASPATSKKR